MSWGSPACVPTAVVRLLAGDWLPEWDDAAHRAVEGRYLENGRISESRRRRGLKPETKFRPTRRRASGPRS